MQTLIDKFGMSATYLIAAAAAVVLLLILLLLARALIGARIRTSGGRSRQPRLGVVDAFDLDRQRQLVLVRRDNVEHLVMIGGPNDVLIESTIIRAAGAAEVRPRVQPTFEEAPPAQAPGQRPSSAAVTPPSIDDLVQAVTPAAAPQPPARSVPAPAPSGTRIEPPPPSPGSSSPIPPPPPPPPVAQAQPPRPLPKMDLPPPPPPPPPPSASAPPPAPPRSVPPPPAPVPAPEAKPAAGSDSLPPPPPAPPSPPPPAEQPRKRFDFGRLVASRQVEAARPPSEPVPAPPPATPLEGAQAAPAPVSNAPTPPKAEPTPAKTPGSIDALEQEMAKLLGRPQGGS